MAVGSICAVDPGEHCGVAAFRGGVCVFAREMAPVDLYDFLSWGGGLFGNSRCHFDVVVVEAFRLYPRSAPAQSWSTLPTVEVIGVLRELCRRDGTGFVTQPASVLRPTRAILRARGTVLLSRRRGKHCRDAELHGWHYLMATANP